MRIIFLSLALILLLSALQIDANAECGRVKIQSTTPLSESGLAYHGQFPWIASLFHVTKGYQCSATIISQRHLLTAAHCVLDDENDYYAIMGRFDLSDSNETHWIRKNISKIYFHEHDNAMTKEKSESNIGIIRVSEDIEYSEYIQPACLPINTNYYIARVLSGIITGYKKTDVIQNTPSYLALKTHYDDWNCYRDFVSSFISWDVLCARSNTTSLCQTDVGAGLYVQNRTSNQNIIYGVTIFIRGQCNVNDLILLIDVSKNIRWIREIIDSKNVYDSCENIDCGDKAECKFDGAAECSCLPLFPGKYPKCVFKCTSDSQCADNELCHDKRCIDLYSNANICVDNASLKISNHREGVCECNEGFEGDGHLRCEIKSNQLSYAELLRNHPNFNLINDESCGTTSMIEGGRLKRIVNGNDAKLLEMPWSALLGYNSQYFVIENIIWRCGGVLIHKNFVLTAAHCINDDLTIVRLGDHKVSTVQDCDDNNNCADTVQDIPIEEKKIHKKYFENVNDIGLLKLATPADTTRNNVRTICLPINEENYLKNFKSAEKILTISGWGRTFRDRQADVLQKAYIPYVEHDKCLEKFFPYPSEIQSFLTYLCAGRQNGSSSCHGDSGSGITATVMQNSQPREMLYGLAAFVFGCNSKYPIIFMNIHYYLNWILDNMS